MPKARTDWTIGAISLLVLLIVAVLLLIPRWAPSLPLDVSALPLLNAGLNAASGLLLVAGYAFVRQGEISRHRACMLSAFGLSVSFLISYVIYHTVAGSTRFAGPDPVRLLYLMILISHVILAALVLPLTLMTLYRAWRGLFTSHRRIARWTLPLWLYVSVSGVLVYVMLYHLSV